MLCLFCICVCFVWCNLYRIGILLNMAAEKEEMRRIAELESLMNQISQGSYHRRNFVVGNESSPRSWPSQQSLFSASSSISNGFSSSEDGSMFDEYGGGIWLDSKSKSKSPDSLCRKSVNEKFVSDYFLAKELNRMSIRDDGRNHGLESNFSNFSLRPNAEKIGYGYGSYEDLNHSRSNLGDVQGDLLYSYTAGDQSNLGLYSDSYCYNNQRNYPLERGMENDIGGRRNRGTQSESSFITMPDLDFAAGAQHYGLSHNRVPKSFASMKIAKDLEAFTNEDSFILQEKGSKKFTPLQEAQNLRERRSNLGLCVNREEISDISDVKFMSGSYSLAEFQGCIYFLAKDQYGCRFLQRMFDEGTTSQDVRIVFDGVIDHAVELMMDPFGNYLMQKLLEVCNEEQRMQIVIMVTREPGQLVRISFNTYGTRVIQKLVETLKYRQEISLVQSALKSGILDLIKDLNGNHVLQRCLECLNIEDNKFIFDAAVKYCIDIATHRHGCCVLQLCITYSTGQYRDKLISQISRNALLLAQDPFGNYVVQYIIDLQISASYVNLLSQFKGHYVQLSTQKFSSHVVEKCLKHLAESRSQIISEFLSVPNFGQLLQDPYANYVIQCALAVAKGNLRATLVEAIRPHVILRTSPYCKRIFSKKVLKK